MAVRDHIPLEQGLRRLMPCPELSSVPGQRPYSIRTRIKTAREMLRRRMLRCQRPYSIRTRIKTRGGDAEASLRAHVRDHIPLEQGLRQRGLQSDQEEHRGQRPYSIRTRIKTSQPEPYWPPIAKSETIFH